ncbi:MAG: XAC2610-related protein [Janthinobacterium lividum]
MLSLPAWSQASYTGTIGPASIELMLDEVAPGKVRGVYLYPRFGNPIALGGTLKNGRLTLTEADAHGKPAATFTVPVFADTASRNTGTWRSRATGRELPLTLTLARKAEAKDGRNELELLQAASLKQVYFKTVLPIAASGNAATFLSDVKLLEKISNRLVNEFVLEDCRPIGTHNVSVGDYNFDGYPDFSVFAGSFEGPNASNHYFLYDPAHKRFMESSFSGVSLKFDPKTKRITERNSCCAGSSVTTVVYKVVDNKMVAVARHCYR